MKKKKSFWKRVDKKTGVASRLLIRFLILCAVIFVVVMVSRGFSARNPIIQPFEVPQTWTEAGLSGGIFAKHVVDELEGIKSFVSSEKADSTTISNSQKLDLDVNVMGVGLSLNSLSYYFQNLFGREPSTISGEVVELGDQMKLTLRMTDFPKQQFTITVDSTDKLSAIEEMTESAAQGILVNTDPYRVAIYQYKNDDYDGSLKTIKTMITRKHKDIAWAYVAWANLLGRQKDQDGSIIKLQQAITLNPKLALAHRNLGWKYVNKRDYSNALKYFQNAYEIDSSVFLSSYALAQIYRMDNQLELSEKYYLRSIDLNPTESNAYVNLAYLKMYQKDSAAGYSILHKATRNVENPVEVMKAMINKYINNGQVDSVEILGAQILELDPTDPDVRFGKSQYFFKARDYDNALMSSKEFLAMADTTKANGPWLTMMTYNMMGMCYYNIDSISLSKKHAQKAIDKFPTVSIPYTTMAEACAVGGDIEGFYSYLERAFELGFNPKALLGDDVYQPFLSSRRFQNLVDKYTLKG